MDEENVKEIAWDETFYTGNPRIDEQHKKIVLTINNLIKERDLTIHSEKFTDALSLLTVYTKEHLEFEESLLEEAGYLELENHKKFHENFIEKIASLSFDASIETGNPEKEILKFLVNWWKHHILIEDMKYKDYISPK